MKINTTYKGICPKSTVDVHLERFPFLAFALLRFPFCFIRASFSRLPFLLPLPGFCVCVGARLDFLSDVVAGRTSVRLRRKPINTTDPQCPTRRHLAAGVPLATGIPSIKITALSPPSLAASSFTGKKNGWFPSLLSYPFIFLFN
ncbi:hypothetical protein TSUD_369300 [Trifolium subterraneum]|uniref:Uncharacterized protein n=1 Tax=Trifolium subterraneum TaxID=3900 RepID=A0A2Z6PN47_TRISU|nr:hypothetical protein TSUD_369300 [Trifolium subterraneum]